MTEIVKEYAEALFALAKEGQNEQAISDALHLVSQSFTENPEYVEFLASPGVPASERTAALEAVFADKMPEYALSFTQLLCEKGHIRSFFACMEEYDLLYRASMEITVAKVVSAVDLNDGEKEAILKKLADMSGKQVSAVFEVDESLLGGVVVHMDGNILDGSLRHRLQEMKEVMEG